MSEKVSREIRQARQKLWRMGNLEWKLKGIQKEMRDAVYNSKGKKTVFLVSRRSGKTYTMMLLAIEQCLKQPNSIVKILFPKKKDAQDVSRFQMKIILDDCPPDLLPVWNEQKKIYTFPNGSEIQMAGTDGGSAESVRGSYCHLAILDEAGFHDYNDFTYIINSIIMPTLLTTKGKMVLASTPSKEPDHPFMTNYVIPSRMDGSLIEYDIYSNPMITEEDIEEITEEYPGGIDDPDFQREFLLRSDIMTDDFVVPEFTKDVQDDIVRRHEQLPAFYDYYVSGDPAGRDLTVILFGYYDFPAAKLVIVDELVRGGQNDLVTTIDIADGIKRKERMYFSNKLTGEVKEPYLRIMDNNNKILINDLINEHNLHFIATDKDNKIAQVNKLRMMVRQGKLQIDPRCKNLIHHLQTARWKKTSKGEKTNHFLRAKGDKSKGLKEHHADAVDALIYMIRNISWSHNPYPDDYFDLKGDDIFTPHEAKYSKNKEKRELVHSIMNIQKKK
jgi:hypothetical protein